ncbi:elongation of very long chain fatty acids protein [Nesidiocoris tenuis]|uniref:Elongation of very long chain fatty acids protein n=1 Tax=Nesidiocoris tenuis TaxID=355587 RepID=A0ABN7AVE4_9HEMI|nr:elongation of very long chain fatty acids protein [Nesidiocoris tenuis]
MTAALGELYSTYQTFLDENVDPRIKHYPLVGSPVPIITIVILYNYFINNWGPAFMKDRPPFQLRRPMIIYNAVQVVVNAWIVYMAVTKIWMNEKFSWVCQGANYLEDELELTVVRLAYFYYLTKIVDLTDTVFMVLRKKNRQISFLHKYHHMGMCLGGWIGTAFVGGGSQIVLFGTLNCIVHTIMYGYYLLVILHPQYTVLSFKRRITELQLIQFTIIFFHGVSVLFIPNCTFPKWVLIIIVPQDVFMFVLFWDFYAKTYLKPQPKTPAKKVD